MFTKKLMRKNYLFRRRRRHDINKHRIMMDKDDQKNENVWGEFDKRKRNDMIFCFVLFKKEGRMFGCFVFGL